MNSFMNTLGIWMLPLMIVSIVCYGIFKKIKVFDCFMQGAKNGAMTVYELLPTLTGLVLAITILKESGAMELTARLFSPLASLLHIPAEIIPMGIISPISGGGSLSFFESILKENGPDSFLGRAGSVLMGSTDTTLYAVTVYYGAVAIKKSRHTLFAGLCADFTSLLLCSFFVNITIR